MTLPENVRILQYSRLEGPSGTDVHVCIVDRDGMQHAFQIETGGNLSYKHLGSGPNAKALMELGIENVLKNVGGYDSGYTLVTERLDSKGERAVGILFSPLFGADWEKLAPVKSTAQELELESFHKLLQRQVTDWKGSYSRFMVANHRYWPTFLQMVHEAVRAEYGPKVKLYRGVYGDYAGAILRGESIKVRPLSAWSLDPNEAKKFALYGGGGGGGGYRKDYWLVIQKSFPVENVLAAPVTLPDYSPDPKIYHAFRHESEVVIHDPKGVLVAGTYKIVQKSQKKLSMASRVALRFSERLS